MGRLTEAIAFINAPVKDLNKSWVDKNINHLNVYNKDVQLLRGELLSFLRKENKSKMKHLGNDYRDMKARQSYGQQKLFDEI